MTKKIVGLSILSLIICQNAWAGAQGGVIPEIPGGFFPVVLLGLAGAVLWMRSVIKK